MTKVVTYRHTYPLSLLLILMLMLSSIGLTALASSPVVDSVTLPGGTSLSVQIDEPTDGISIPFGKTVSVSGSATIGEVVPLTNTLLVYTLDLSGSTSAPSGSTTCGNPDGVGNSNTILDCEIAAMINLNNAAISRSVAEVGLVGFAGRTTGDPNPNPNNDAVIADVDAAVGSQMLVDPSKKTDGVTSDAERALRSARTSPEGQFLLHTSTLRIGTWTNFYQGVLRSMEVATASTMQNKIVVFVSDGDANAGPSRAVLQNLLGQANNQGITFYTFSIGAANCERITDRARLRDISDLTGGTCTNVTDMSSLPTILPILIDANLTKLEMSINGGAPVAIPAAHLNLSLPQTGPKAVEFSTDVTGLAAGNHEICVIATGTDPQSGEAKACIDINVITNQPPDIAANGASVTFDEGSEATMAGTVSDPDSDPVTLSASVGTVVDNGDGTWSWSYTPADGVNPPATTVVTITAEDDQGDSSHAAFDLIVNNVAPSVTITSPTEGQLFANGATVNLSANVVDPGVNDIVTCTVDWGDGAQPGTMNAGFCTSSLQFNEPGVYSVTVVATDKDGDSGQASVMFVVFGQGSVTGGGWINSPAGAYTVDPGLSGKATFGFTSQYKKGATVPTGTSQFQFHAGNLNVHSIAYEWLVVTQNSTNAQFKGTATVNGAATNADGHAYRFMIWAGDGNPDTFRIRVWTEDGSGTETTVYDNGTQQALGGGSIVIHKLK